MGSYATRVGEELREAEERAIPSGKGGTAWLMKFVNQPDMKG